MRAALASHLPLLASGTLAFVLMGAGQALYTPALSGFEAHFSLSFAATSWLVTAHWLGSALAVILIYFAAPHVRLFYPPLAMGLGALGLAFAPLWPLALASALLFGFGFGLSTSVFNPKILAAFGRLGPNMLGLLNAAYALGAIVMPLAVSFALTAGGGAPPRLSAHFLALAVFALMVLALALRAARREGAAIPLAKAATPAAPLNLDFRVLTLGVLGVGLEISLVVLAPFALIGGYGLAQSAAVLGLSLFFVAFFFGRMSLVFTGARLSPFWQFIGAALFLALLCFFIVIGLPSLPLFTVMGAAAGLFFPTYYAMGSAQLGPDPRSPALLIGAGLVGGAVAPRLLAPLAEGAPQAFFPVLAALAVLAAILTLSHHRLRHPLPGAHA